MLDREVFEPVFGSRRIEQVARDHRVEVETLQSDPMALQQDGVELQVVPDFADRRIFEHRLQGGERRLERQRSDVVQPAMPGRHVIGVVRQG